MRLLVTPTSGRALRKPHRRQKADLDEAARTVATNPECGEAKVGDLKRQDN